MRRALKWLGLLLGVLLAVVFVAAVGLSVAGATRLNKTREVAAENISIPADEAAVARGEHMVQVACTGCHGADLAGQPLLDDPAIGTVYSANISGLAGTHSDADLVRAIRHAVDKDGRQLMIMPAEAFIHFSEEDLAAVIAYLKTVPRTGSEHPEPRLGAMGRILMGAGMMGNMFPADYIDHEMPFPEMPEIGANLAYGEYLTGFCQSCHGAELAGGPPPQPDSPPAPNLTPGGALQGWTEAEFLTLMHTGRTPSGRQLDPQIMPWESFGKLDDKELRGLWMYLQSLPPQETATQ